MTKKKFLALALVLMMVASAMLVGCAPAADNAGESAAPEATQAPSPEETPATTEPLKVGLLVSGPVNDGGWGASAYAGLLQIEEKYGAEINYTESIPQSDYEEAFRNYATLGYDIVFGHGYEFGDAAKVVGLEFPDTMFIVTSTNIFQEPNVASMNTLPIEMGLIQGIAAGYMTKSKVVGAIGGMPIPSITDPLNAFGAAALSVDPSITVLLHMTGDFEDAALAKESAIAMMDKGADVLMYDADSAGLGVVEAAKERGVMLIPSIANQNDLAPDLTILSGICDVATGMMTLVQYYTEGTLTGQFYSLGASTGCVFYEPNEAVFSTMSAEGQAAVEDMYQKLKNGEIDANAFIAEHLPAELKLG